MASQQIPYPLVLWVSPLRPACLLHRLSSPWLKTGFVSSQSSLLFCSVFVFIGLCKDMWRTGSKSIMSWPHPFHLWLSVLLFCLQLFSHFCHRGDIGRGVKQLLSLLHSRLYCKDCSLIPLLHSLEPRWVLNSICNHLLRLSLCPPPLPTPILVCPPSDILMHRSSTCVCVWSESYYPTCKFKRRNNAIFCHDSTVRLLNSSSSKCHLLSWRGCVS